MPARKVTLDGIQFDSVAESNRYLVLRQMEADGEISDLKAHSKDIEIELLPRLVLSKHQTISRSKYTPDFTYTRNGVTVIEDVKSKRTDGFNMRWKLLHHKFAEAIRAGAVVCQLVDARNYRS